MSGDKLLNYSDDQAKSKPTALEGADPAFSKPDSKLKITLVAAGGCTLIAVLGLLGYIPGLKLLGSIGSTFIPMAPSTALSFIVLGGIMLISTYQPPSNRSLNIFSFLATLVALFGALEVVGFFLGMDLNFEEQLIPEFGTLEKIPIGRMSMPTGALLFLAGLATVALLLPRKMPQRRILLEHLSSGLGTVILITSLVFCGAYLFGSPLLYGQGSAVPMALTTALAFLAFGVSIIAETGGKGPFIWLLKLPFRTNHKPFSAGRRLILLVSVMVGVVMICMSILLTILFRHESSQHEINLLTSAQNQVLIIENIVEHNIARAEDLKDENPDFDPYLATLHEITEALINIGDLDQTIEFTLAQQKGDSIVFLQTHRAVESSLSEPIPMNSAHAEPQRRALRGETGTMVGTDYQGKEVLAAYSFVKELNLGVVVKIDMAEIRAPFIRAALFGIVITGIIIIIGSLVFIRIGNPVIRRLEDHSKNLQNEISQRKQVEKLLSESESKYRTLFEGVPDAIFFFDPVTFEILNANKATSNIYGYDRAELIGMSCLKFSAEIDKSKGVATKIIKDGQSSADYRHHKKKDGSDLYVNLTGHKITVNGNDLFFSVCRDVTQRKQTEEALRESEEKYRLIVENANDGIEITQEDKILFSNARFAEMLGYATEELLNKKFSSFFTKQATQSLHERAKQRKNGVPLPSYYETTFKKKDGTIIDVDVKFEITEYKEKPATFAIIRDITERKQLEASLKESEQDFRRIIENAATGIYRTAPDGQIILANNALINILGYSSLKELTDINVNDEGFKSKGDRAAFLERIESERVIKGLESEWQKANGEIIIVSENARVVCDNDGNTLFYEGTVEDISERKQMDEILKRNEIMLTEAMKIAKLGAWEYDVTSDQFTFNDQFYSLLHTTAEQEGGYIMSSAHYAQKFVHPEEMILVGSETQKAIETTDPNYYNQLDHRIVCADGEVRYITVHIRIRKDAQGRTVRTHGVNQDITERKQAEEALAQSDSLRELLLDIVTHDLKNPAGVIYALSETARKNLPENKFLEAIYTSSGRLMEVLAQTTTLSQAAFGETIPKETLSLEALIKETANEFASDLNKAEMELVIAIAPDLIIEANPLIREVFKNYISNAIKYATDGKRIVIESVLEDQAVVVRVKDFGKTIAQADRGQIFQRRIQLENGKGRGRGLGLAIVKRIAGAHGGEVWVEPNTPVGNSFCLRIPL